MKATRRVVVFLEICAWFVVEGLKGALDARMRRHLAPGLCTRPHRCRVDGPCNGYPRVDS